VCVCVCVCLCVCVCVSVCVCEFARACVMTDWEKVEESERERVEELIKRLDLCDIV
jgi:hypothetical protein